MSTAYMKVKDLTYYDSKKACIGATLLTPSEGEGLWLIDMMGRIVEHWDMGCKPSSCGELLPNGHLLYAGKDEKGPLAELKGAGGIVLESDWDGNKLWEFRDQYLHHSPYRMKSGNTLILKWVRVPDKVASEFKGGVPGSERKGVMWGDAIQEVTPEGEVVWEWIAHEHLRPSVDVICPFCPRSTWPCATATIELANGNILTNLRGVNTLAIINKKTGNIIWRWGKKELAHPHYLSELDNGNILVFDDGLHAIGAHGSFSRALEINPKTNQLVWSYGAFGDIFRSFYSPTMSSCQRLPNGNTLVCEGIMGRVFEITRNGGPVWEYINAFPSQSTATNKPEFYPLYGALRYEMSYSGLERSIPVPEAKQAAPGTPGPATKQEEAVRSRVEALGY